MLALNPVAGIITIQYYRLISNGVMYKMNKKFFFIALFLLSSCGDNGPTKQDAQEILTSNSRWEVAVNELKCSKHENDLYVCFLAFSYPKNINSIQTRENLYFRKLNDKWEIENFTW